MLIEMSAILTLHSHRSIRHPHLFDSNQTRPNHEVHMEALGRRSVRSLPASCHTHLAHWPCPRLATFMDAKSINDA